MSPMKNPKVSRKQTGTVPKVTASQAASLFRSALTAPPKSAAVKEPQQQSSTAGSSQKNTEVVAPTRRDLHDLNDYLLSVAESSNATRTISKQPNSNEQSHSEQLDSSCFDLDNLNLHENQRYCWPVRPLPRRSSPNRDYSSDIQSTLAHSSNIGNIHSINYTTSNASGLSSQAIGVVIPTTPNSTLNEYNYSSLNRLQHHQPPQSLPANLNSTGSHHHHHQPNNHQHQTDLNQTLANLDCELTWEQRLNFIQYFLSLTSRNLNKVEKKTVGDKKEDSVREQLEEMVNETQSELYLNSTSLEDVAQTETNDTRAQSVTSIHSASIPTTPTYEELQAKLEASNRNIQNIKEQQQQLLRLQQAAKDHLVEMENIRNQRSRTAHYEQNGSEPPNYESIGQVQSDMASLVGRMKNITTFIQSQNELSALLGDDGPEILAEQEALQNKLIELQQQKEDIRHFVNELEEVNACAENSVKQRRQEANEVPRVVPIEYQRIVPIELIGSTKNQSNSAESSTNADEILSNGHCNGNSIDHMNPDHTSTSIHPEDDESEVTEEASGLIKQKMADIAAMKNQLKRLKDMMDTVKLIEGKTEGRSIQEIADEAEEFLASTVRGQAEGKERCHRNQSSAQREIAAKEQLLAEAEEKNGINAENEVEMTEKVRILHEMTQDLRDQATNLANERDRLKALRDEMVRRKEAENLEMSASKRSEVVQNSIETEKHQIRAEYDAKKKEFEKLCERLQSENDSVLEQENERHDEDNTDAVKHTNSTNASYYQDNWRPQNVISSNSSGRGETSAAKQSTVPATPPPRGKDSADSGAADVHGMASFEAGSMQSGSSRSFSMPPPMRTINTRDTAWRKNSQDNSQSQYEIYAPMPPPLPTWNSSYYYSTPYAQHFNMHPHAHHHPVNPPPSSDYFCSHNCHPLNPIGQGVPTTNNGTQPVGQQSNVNTSDPVLLQQFIQTQQMLINSVCQCNQLLWHQQREINNLNNAVMMLQERLLHPMNADANQNTHRAESVPPTGVTVANNVYTSHRAQSEQPNQPYQTIQQPLSSPSRNHHFHSYNYTSNFHRRTTNSMHQQQQTPMPPNNAAAYNYPPTDHATGVCSQLPPVPPQLNHGVEFVNVPPSPQTSGFLNNDASHSAHLHQHHPASHPVYMHHHNNTIAPADVVTVSANLQQQHQGPPPVQPQSHLHTNNHSNLLTSQQPSCLNSPPTANVPQSAVTSSTITHGPNNTNAVAAASALNNQVPPGNRANNYWDNFRSYSRQNLLSTNSCKSNEEQQQQPISGGTPAFPINGSNTNLNGFRNLHNAMNAINAVTTGNSASYSNNLTPPTFDSGKHLYTFRNHLNSNLFNDQESSQTPLNHVSSQPATAVIHSLQATQGNYVLNAPVNRSATGALINQATQSDNLNVNSNGMPSNNINTSNNANASVAAIFGSNDFRNMNFNFGANELRKKISVKSACSTKRIRHSQSMTNEMTPLNRGSTSSNDFDESSGAVNELAPPPVSRTTGRNIYDDYEDQHQLESEFNDDDNVNADNSNASGYSESSEENKKNLLANALRNDKFTSKFFERLKEDVYREVYSILQATESQPQYLEQLYKELQLVPTNDPIRNIVMQAMHDIYKRSSIVDNGSSENYANNSSDTNIAPISPYESANPSPATQSENNQETELMNTLLNSTELRRLAYKIMFDSERSSSPFEKVGTKPNLSSSSASSSPKPTTEIYRPDYDLVNHIMNIVRNSIQTPRFDDDSIMNITKLTISTLERIAYLSNNSLPTDRLGISPRELYRRMRTFDRRDREGFLTRYEALLQTILVMKVVNDDANNLNLVTMKKISSSNANMLTNSLSSSNSSDSHNLRRHNLTGKSNISGHSASLNCLEMSGGSSGRKIDRQHCDAGNGGHSEVTSANGGNSYSSRSLQDDLKRQQHSSSSQKDSKSRRPKTNTSSPATLNQLILTANSNVENDISPNSDTLSSSTINSNNITNEDLAEADQVCSSDSPAPIYCDTGSGSSSTKFPRNDHHHHQKHQQKLTSAEEYIKEVDDNKNFGWKRKDTMQSESGMHISSKQEAESENFEISNAATLSHGNNSNLIETGTIFVGEVTSSACASGKTEDIFETEPITYDTACAVIPHQMNSNAGGSMSDSVTDRMSLSSTSPSNGNTATVDGKHKNGVP